MPGLPIPLWVVANPNSGYIISSAFGNVPHGRSDSKSSIPITTVDTKGNSSSRVDSSDFKIETHGESTKTKPELEQ